MTTENTDKGQTPAEADSQGHCALGDGSAAAHESGTPCERCGGQGWYPWYDSHEHEIQTQCEMCNGTGRIEERQPPPNDRRSDTP